MPHVDILLNQLQKRKTEPVQVKMAIDNFEKCIVDVRNKIDDIINEAKSNCTLTPRQQKEMTASMCLNTRNKRMLVQPAHNTSTYNRCYNVAQLFLSCPGKQQSSAEQTGNAANVKRQNSKAPRCTDYRLRKNFERNTKRSTGLYCHEEIIKQINRASYLAIIADETTDISGKTQLVTIFRCVFNGERPHTANSFERSMAQSLAAQDEAELWFCSNKLLLNKDKTKRMVFSMRSLPGDSDLVGEAKFLGVTLDPRLQWGLHIDSVAGKATKEEKTEPAQVKTAIDNFEKCIVDVRNKIDGIINGAKSICTEPQGNKRRRRNNSSHGHRVAALEVCGNIVDSANDRLNVHDTEGSLLNRKEIPISDISSFRSGPFLHGSSVGGMTKGI
ncbi:unnamed protein product [Acanthoscelides obtectus]|uniref:DUF4371 domain-containing protein n=1 Tax=Acanthoscelides obtectus TaxID=200917 RepID=A0A9P0MCY5_ACAOB|nr:unnamed protein product [Acanthoscelides obtectus]CAK1665448.1 hypothetical protein AOBTE_LOCUS24821 [Acanthoscelides obtectus]